MLSLNPDMNYQKDAMLLPNDYILFEQFMLSQEISCNNNKPINQASYSFVNQGKHIAKFGRCYHF